MTNLLSNPQPLEEMPRTVQTVFFSHNIIISFTFRIVHVSSGRERVGGGENLRHLALPQETEGRPPTSLHVTNGDENDPVNNIN